MSAAGMGDSTYRAPNFRFGRAVKREQHNESVTEMEEIPNRGHALTIDTGRRAVADKALAFIKRFV
jgi:non-heme chloroperoxidase